MDQQTPSPYPTNPSQPAYYPPSPPPFQPPYPPHLIQPPQTPYSPYPFPPSYPPKKAGIRGWAAALIAVGAFFLGILLGSQITSSVDQAVQSLPDGEISYPYQENMVPYGLNETASVSGTVYDISFFPCSFSAEITMTSYVRGSEANAEIQEMGGDLTLLPDGMEYVLATFQIEMLSSDSNAAVMINPRYFSFDISESTDDAQAGNFPENGIQLENLMLQPGDSGTITAFAAIPKNSENPDLYFSMEDGFVLFAP